jgi:alkylhydroperoxidase family enzyme
MSRIPLSDLGDTTAERILGHRPELLGAWASLRQALVGPSSTLSPHLKEEVRRTVAQHTGCAYRASLGRPAARQQDEREALAVALAEAVAAEHTAISGAQVTGLFDAFTIPRVVELLTWISFGYAGQMLGSLVGGEPASAEGREAFAASVGQPAPAQPLSRAAATGCSSARRRL